VRDTVTATAAASADVVSQQVSETLQTPFSVPSLESQGMQFRRAQWLAIDEQPLLQLAYLPDNGKPLAVCVLKKDIAEDKPAEYGETGGMQYVHWQRGEHAVVIVGTVSPDRLQDINGIIERELL
jgi:anti-sigma factor RsiW